VGKTRLHYVENNGDADLTFIEIFKTDRCTSFVLRMARAHAGRIGDGASFDKSTYDADSEAGRCDHALGLGVPTRKSLSREDWRDRNELVR
jgi:hypothetical protein